MIDLYDLKDNNEHKSLIEGLFNYVEERIDMGLLNSFRQNFMPRSMIEARFMKLESKLKKLNKNCQKHETRTTTIEETIETFPDMFLDKATYRTETKNFARKTDVKLVDEKLVNFTRIDVITKELDEIKA